MNDVACTDSRDAESKMNGAMATILEQHRTDRKFVDKLKKAQRAWLAFRQAQLEAIFPHDASDYGTVLPMCRCGILAELTANRTKELMQWTSGIEAGDVCTGSRAVKK